MLLTHNLASQVEVNEYSASLESGICAQKFACSYYRERERKRMRMRIRLLTDISHRTS